MSIPVHDRADYQRLVTVLGKVREEKMITVGQVLAVGILASTLGSEAFGQATEEAGCTWHDVQTSLSTIFR